MKKNICILFAEIMISLTMISGCSASGSSVNNVEAATESREIKSTETENTETENTETESTETESNEITGSETDRESSETQAVIGKSGAEMESEEFIPEEESVTEEGREEKAAPVRIWGVVTEISENSIIVDNQSDNSSPGEMVLMIDANSTYVLDGGNGFPVAMDEVQAGSFYAYLGPAMMMSLPPQSVPYAVIVNIPEDTAAPLYVITEDTIGKIDDAKVLTANDGTEYKLAEDARIQPFLTKNIVQMEDIHKGSECLLWLNTEGAVARIVLLSE